MRIELLRIASGEDDTIGIIHLIDESSGETVRRPLCFTLEDEFRSVKVRGETRIPAGVYRVTLRTEGGHHERYNEKYPWHRGMLWIRDVPGFQFILFHIGNDEDDTEGCVLTADVAEMDAMPGAQGRTVQRSARAYERFYKTVVRAAAAGELEVAVLDYA